MNYLQTPKTNEQAIISQADLGNRIEQQNIKIKIEKLNTWYNSFQAIKDTSLNIYKNSITSIIGPSGCGKSTLLRCLNRMNDSIPGFRKEGNIFLDGKEIYSKIDLTELRRRIGMVFQRPNPFPLSVFENIAYGPKVHGLASKKRLNEIVENSLKATNLFDELKDKLDKNALSLSPEQQQRLCISRALAVAPDALLMDEPCSALDPIATMKIEELMLELKESRTIVIVTHNMQQAARASDWCGFMWLGELVEFDKTTVIFTTPKNKKTEGYITGKFG